MPGIFYKAVLHAHITGLSLIPIERGPGIRQEGLDPKKRNASGGATAVAAAQSGRKLNSSDSTSFGQCLTGTKGYAEDYATSDNHRLLRIILADNMLGTLVRSASSYEDYATMQAAVDDKECTAIANIPAVCIEYLTSHGKWQSLKTYPNPAPKRFGDASDSDDDD